MNEAIPNGRAGRLAAEKAIRPALNYFQGPLARPLSVFLGLLFFTLLARAQTFGNPVLGFDEQYYLLVGDRMLQGAVPFVDIFDRKPIGLFLIYAAIRSLGGDGFVQYQIVASCFVAATAFLIYRAARRLGDGFSAAIAACLYILWLSLMDCEGGQAPIFYNLPVALAALLTLRAATTQRSTVALGCAAMLFAGVAIQIKYTAIFEGCFFGLALLWARYRSDRRILPLAGTGLLWMGCALLPTALAALAYWHIGAWQAFLFANFLSGFGRLPDPLLARFIGILEIAAILSPLIGFAAFGPRSFGRDRIFIWIWLGVATFAVLAVGTYLNPHYAAPMLVPLAIAAAPGFSGSRRRHFTGLGLVALALVVGQAVIAFVTVQKGGRPEAMAVADAARPRHGCLYVYDGYPALYLLTHSCLPTRWIFPGLFNAPREASRGALGIDPLAGERQVLQSRPEVIVDVFPANPTTNAGTHALVTAALARDYHLAAKIRISEGNYQLVYRLN